MAIFNISQLFQQAFGYEMPESEFNIPDAEQMERFSSLGPALYEADVYGREFFLPVWLDDIMLPFPVISVTSKKTIVSTPLVERQGTVKELINTQDWMISIKGIIVRPDNKFPEEEIKELTALYLQNNSIKMKNALTSIFLRGDDKVVIKSLDWPAMSGVEHAKAYSMELESDLIYTLEIV